MPTLVERTARQLTALSLAGAEGSYLGNEDELLARFAISRPTLRQAAKMVATDRLIEVRRGAAGGFYAARPDAADAVRMLARFLRLKGATLADILAVEAPVSEEAAAHATSCEDAALRAELKRLASRIGAEDTASAMIRAEAELARLLAAMSGNAAIELVMAIGYAFGFDEQGVRLFEHEADRAQICELQRALVQAVLDRDPEVARLMMRRRLAIIGRWVRDGGGSVADAAAAMPEDRV